MLTDLTDFITKNQRVAVAVSGGSDSMALLHFLCANAPKLGFSVIALNVEHGIRGRDSLLDSEFVKNYCYSHDVPLLSYSVDSIKKSKQDKVSIETAARLLRYDCFFDAIKTDKCDLVATAHHSRDNVESVLFNLFRGTGLKGVCGIGGDYGGKIIRPFISVKKDDITAYIKENNIPFVIDKTNFEDDASRNFIRLNVLPKIKELFPDAENAISRFSLSAKRDEDFLSALSEKHLSVSTEKAEISLPIEYPLLARAVISALKSLDVKKDWETCHFDAIYSLCSAKNGAKIDLLGGVKAYKEYDKIVITNGKNSNGQNNPIPYKLGTFEFFGKTYKTELLKTLPKSLKGGFYADLDKIPSTAVIRSKTNGDKFTKFGGGTKKLNDYFTDVKIPLRERESVPVLAVGKTVLAIFGVAISDKIKIDGATRKIIKLS